MLGELFFRETIHVWIFNKGTQVKVGNFMRTHFTLTKQELIGKAFYQFVLRKDVAFKKCELDFWEMETGKLEKYSS